MLNIVIFARFNANWATVLVRQGGKEKTQNDQISKKKQIFRIKMRSIKAKKPLV